MNIQLFIIVTVAVFSMTALCIGSSIYLKIRKIARTNRDASDLIKWEMWDDAILLLQSALKLDPDHSLTIYNIGFALYMGKNMPGPAEEKMRHAIHADNRCAGAYYALGHLLFHSKKNIDEAIACLQKALQLNPGLAEAYNTLGLIEIYKANWRESIGLFEKAIAANDRYDATFCNLSIACQCLGRSSDAIGYAKQYVKLQPQSALARRNLGNIYGACGKRDEAIGQLVLSLLYEPENWNVHFWLGCLYLQIHASEKAIVSFSEALRLHGDFALAHYNLALSYEAIRQTGLARVHIDKAIELNPELGKDLI